MMLNTIGSRSYVRLKT